LNGTYGSYILLSKATDPIGKSLGKTIGKPGKTIGKTIGEPGSAICKLMGLMCDGSELVSVVLQHRRLWSSPHQTSP
jgi:hypothetical protein